MLHEEAAGPFDLIFIDADKQNNPTYVEWALKLSRPGTILVCDNVIREGEIVDGASTDPSVIGTRLMFEKLAASGRVRATAIQTVGAKGYDGFLIALLHSTGY